MIRVVIDTNVLVSANIKTKAPKPAEVVCSRSEIATLKRGQDANCANQLYVGKITFTEFEQKI